MRFTKGTEADMGSGGVAVAAFRAAPLLGFVTAPLYGYIFSIGHTLSPFVAGSAIATICLIYNWVK